MDSKATRLHDAKLGSALENASAKLPDGYEIVITIEASGLATVSLLKPDGDRYLPFGPDTMAGQINDATAYAIKLAEQS